MVDALTESESRYRLLFEDSALSLWVEDFSKAKEFMNNLKSSGVKGLRKYFEENQEALLRCVSLVQVLDVNRATMTLHGVQNKKEMLGSLDKILSDDALSVFLDQLLALNYGNLPYESEIEEMMVLGEKKALVLQLTVPPQYSESLKRVFLTIIDATERKKAEDEIRSSLAEKEFLLKEIHHRVKNNLQIISSLLFLQAQKSQIPEIVNSLKESEHRIKSMALIHELLYESKDLAKIDFERYMKSLGEYLLSSFGMNTSDIALKIDVICGTISIDIAIPCALIVNELVSNAMKYAFPGNRPGEIEISLKALGNDELELAVSDNGVGLPANPIPKRGETLGIQLVTNLVERQLKGTLEVDVGTRTRYVIRFKNIGGRSDE